MKRELFIEEINNDLVGREGENYLEEYKSHSAVYYAKSLMVGLLVSLTGGFIALHSFIGPFPSRLVLFLNVFFSAVVLFGLYGALFLLPRYFTSE